MNFATAYIPLVRTFCVPSLVPAPSSHAAGILSISLHTPTRTSDEQPVDGRPDCQCMACSNNVVRCALTPKFRDVDLLVEMLTYNMAAPSVLHAIDVDGCRRRFTPPTSEFEIELIHVSSLREAIVTVTVIASAVKGHVRLRAK